MVNVVKVFQWWKLNLSDPQLGLFLIYFDVTFLGSDKHVTDSAYSDHKSVRKYLFRFYHRIQVERSYYNSPATLDLLSFQ